MRLLLLLLAACSGSPTDPEPTTPTGPLACDGDEGPATALSIQPYVQSVGTTGAWILWETPNEGVGSRVEYGTTDALGQVACGAVLPLNPDADPALEPSAVHEVELADLPAGTRVYYRVHTGQTASAVHHFKTQADPADEAPLRIVAFGDSQIDSREPGKFTEVVQDGAIDFVRENHGEDLSEELSMVIHVGDLVDNGWLQVEWVNQFFAPAAELFSQVPIFPIAGNHEGNSPLYDRYFHLPGNEHYYTVDNSNTRLIGLDSNGPWDNQDQLVWLDEILDQTCDDPTIDFVFAQLHHPALSELWTPGESDWSAQVVLRLELFSTDCGKPSIHFFGHTHGYSRGQSQSHQHLWMNVSSSGGALDRWGEQPQVDYDTFVASQDQYGFVLVDVTAGDDPQFSIRRISRGTPEAPLDNVLSDSITIRRDNSPPGTPSATAAVPQTCNGPAALAATAFTDPDGDGHQGSHWQIAADCAGFDDPLVDRWKQDKNEYAGVDTQAGDDLTDEVFPELFSGQVACWRVRYRDAGLVWSAWSSPAAITLPDCP